MQRVLLSRHVAICSLVLVFLCGMTVSAVEGGYASETSVPQGGRVDFHISTRATTYDLRVFREGAQRTLLREVDGLPGTERACEEPGYETGCGWPVAYSLDVPAEWPTGVYVADFQVGVDGRDRRLVPFVVREDRPGSVSPVLFTLATNTHQAYNGFGGKSLYAYNSSDEEPATTVSFERPYGYPGDGNYYKREHPFVAWIEESGYTVEYATNQDLHRDAGLLSHYGCFVCCGHDEYWTREMRDHLDAFVASGGNALILGGNTCWWQVRFSPDLKRMIGYKERALTDDPFVLDGDPSNDRLVTTNWYRPPVDHPENSTTGLGWRHGGYHDHGATFPASEGFGGYRVYRTDHWVFDGTGLSDGDLLGRDVTIVGYEVDGTLLEARDAEGRLAWDADGYYPRPGALPYVVRTEETRTPSDLIVLGLAPASKGHGVMGIFQRAGGGQVFNAGTIDWVQGLAADAQVARITDNLIRELGALVPTQNRRPVASIEGIEPRVARVGEGVSLRGRGRDADGTVVAYRWRSSRDGDLSSQMAFTTRALTVGLHRILFSVRDDAGAWSAEAEGSVLVVSGDPGTEEYILDEGEAGTAAVGDWRASDATGQFGASSLYSRDPTASYAFTVPLSTGGYHEVSIWWTSFWSRLRVVPVEVVHAGGTEVIFVDQQAGGGEWRFLGTWAFESEATITILSAGGGTTSVDAVRLVRREGPFAAPTASIDAVSTETLPPGEKAALSGHGTDPDGTVVAYLWRSSLDGKLSEAPAFETAGLSPGTHTISFKVRDDHGLWSREESTTVEVIGEGPEDTMAIVDNGDEGTASTGLWTASGASGQYGKDSLFSRERGATYTFDVPLGMSGVHEVHLWWTAFSSRLGSVPIEVSHRGGTSVVFVDQRQGGGDWRSIGAWSFEGVASITIISLGDGSTCADAVKLVRRDGANAFPKASIDEAPTAPSVLGTEARFAGHGTDVDGGIAEYLWRSDLDGELSQESGFATKSLSAGRHTISLAVRDDRGAWSDETRILLRVVRFQPRLWPLREAVELPVRLVRVLADALR